MEQLREHGAGDGCEREFDAKYPCVRQIDLVPTVCMLLGVDVPFGNLGSLIPHLFFRTEDFNGFGGGGKGGGKGGGNNENDESEAMLMLLQRMRVNSQQIHRFLQTHERHHPGKVAMLRDSLNPRPTHPDELPSHMLGQLLARFDELERNFDSLTHPSPPRDLHSRMNATETSHPHIQDSHQSRHSLLLLQYRKFMREALQMCQEVWAQFNLWKMWVGFVLMFGGTMSLVTGRSSPYHSWNFHLAVLVGALVVLGWSGGWILAGVGGGWMILNFSSNLHHPPIPAILPSTLLHGLHFMVICCHSMVFASNSLVVFEGWMVSYFLQTFYLLLAFRYFFPTERRIQSIFDF